MRSPVSNLHLCCGDVCSKTDNAIRSSNVFYGAKVHKPLRAEVGWDRGVCVCVQQVIVLRMFFVVCQRCRSFHVVILSAQSHLTTSKVWVC